MVRGVNGCMVYVGYVGGIDIIDRGCVCVCVYVCVCVWCVRRICGWYISIEGVSVLA